MWIAWLCRMLMRGVYHLSLIDSSAFRGKWPEVLPVSLQTKSPPRFICLLVYFIKFDLIKNGKRRLGVIGDLSLYVWSGHALLQGRTESIAWLYWLSGQAEAPGDLMKVGVIDGGFGKQGLKGGNCAPVY